MMRLGVVLLLCSMHSWMPQSITSMLQRWKVVVIAKGLKAMCKKNLDGAWARVQFFREIMNSPGK